MKNNWHVTITRPHYSHIILLYLHTSESKRICFSNGIEMGIELNKKVFVIVAIMSRQSVMKSVIYYNFLLKF